MNDFKLHGLINDLINSDNPLTIDDLKTEIGKHIDSNYITTPDFKVIFKKWEELINTRKSHVNRLSPIDVPNVKEHIGSISSIIEKLNKR